MDSVIVRFTKLLIIIIIRAMQALSSFQCEAKAPEQSGAANLLLQIRGFLQFSSTRVKWAEKYPLEEEEQQQQHKRQTKHTSF